MTTPEPPGEPTPPSFEKPAAGGSPYGNPPKPSGPPRYPAPEAPPANADPYAGGNPYTSADPYAGGGGDPYAAGIPSYRSPAADSVDAARPAMPPLGGLGERLVARIIDWVVLLVVGGLIASAIVFTSDIDDYYIVTVTILFAGLVGLVYEALMLSRTGGQTLGKRVMKLRVAMLADGAPPFGAAVWVRSAVFWLPVVLSGFCLPALFWLLDVLWCTWDRPYRQCLHDKAAKTVVVRAD